MVTDGNGRAAALSGKVGSRGISPAATAQCAQQATPAIECDGAPVRHMFMSRSMSPNFCSAIGAAVKNVGSDVPLARAPPTPIDHSKAAAITNTHHRYPACPNIGLIYHAWHPVATHAGWYRHPDGTVAHEWHGHQPSAARTPAEKQKASQPRAKDIEFKAVKPDGNGGHQH
jgi:hypothetical protein